MWGIPINSYRILPDNSYMEKYGLTIFCAFCSLASPQTYMSHNQLQYALGYLKIWPIVGLITYLTGYVKLSIRNILKQLRNMLLKLYNFLLVDMPHFINMYMITVSV